MPRKRPIRQLETLHRRIQLSSYSHAFPAHAANLQAPPVQRSGLGFRDGFRAQAHIEIRMIFSGWDEFRNKSCPFVS